MNLFRLCSWCGERVYTDKLLCPECTRKTFTDNRPPDVVYFIQCNNYLKIGRSKKNTPTKRVSELSTGNPYDINIIHAIPFNQPYTERQLHKKFNHIRLKGEWFYYTDELKDFIITLKAKGGPQMSLTDFCEVYNG